jgi:uncharacterized membrane protein YczE
MSFYPKTPPKIRHSLKTRGYPTYRGQGAMAVPAFCVGSLISASLGFIGWLAFDLGALQAFALYVGFSLIIGFFLAWNETQNP